MERISGLGEPDEKRPLSSKYFIWLMWLSIHILDTNDFTLSRIRFVQSDASSNISRSSRDKGREFCAAASNTWHQQNIGQDLWLTQHGSRSSNGGRVYRHNIVTYLLGICLLVIFIVAMSVDFQYAFNSNWSLVLISKLFRKGKVFNFLLWRWNLWWVLVCHYYLIF